MLVAAQAVVEEGDPQTQAAIFQPAFPRCVVRARSLQERAQPPVLRASKPVAWSLCLPVGAPQVAKDLGSKRRWMRMILRAMRSDCERSWGRRRFQEQAGYSLESGRLCGCLLPTNLLESQITEHYLFFFLLSFFVAVGAPQRSFIGSSTAATEHCASTGTSSGSEYSSALANEGESPQFSETVSTASSELLSTTSHDPTSEDTPDGTKGGDLADKITISRAPITSFC